MRYWLTRRDTMQLGLLPFVMVLASAKRTLAQAPEHRRAVIVHVPSQPVCANCEIVLREGLAIGTDDDAGALSTIPEVVLRLSSGEFVVAGMRGVEVVPRLYDSRGRYVRTLGRRGAGPGEFSGVQAGFVASDSVFLFDRGNARLSVLTPTLKVARYAPAPQRLYDAVPVTGGFAVSADFHDPTRVGYPLHLFDQLGTYRLRGSDTAETVPLSGGTRSRRLARARDGGFWSIASYGEYVLMRWDAEGRLLRKLVIASDWFESGLPLRPITPTAPPQTIVFAVREDSLGRLWILARVADPRWQEGLGPVQSIEGHDMSQVIDQERVFDGIIEVIDLATGRVLARRRLDFPVFRMISNDLIAAFSETGNRGEPVLRLLTVSLRRR